MLRLLPADNWTRASLRRAAAAAVMALQAVIALSPMLERRDDVRRDRHIEALGNRHLFAHDDSTCTMCAARTLMGTAPVQSAANLPAVATGRVVIAYLGVGRERGVTQDNHSRAPPRLG